MTIWPYHPKRVLLLAVSTNPWEKETITIYLLFQVPRIWFPGRAKDYAIQGGECHPQKTFFRTVKTASGAKFWVIEEVYLTENGILKGPFPIESFDENDRTYTLTEKDEITQWGGGKKVTEENLRHGKK